MINAAAIVGAPGWRLTEQNGYLVAIAGADEIWVVDDVPGQVAAELAPCWSDTPPTPDQLSRSARLAVEQLRAVGVFGTPSPLGPRPQLAIAWAGHEVPQLQADLASLCSQLGWPKPSVDLTAQTDVVIMVRTSETLIKTAELADPLTRAGRLQLFCDLGSSRTVALGPLVAPGHSSCIGCLAERIGQRWGDPSPPEQPAATGPVGTATAAAWLIRQLELALSGRFPLVDRTVSIDLDSLESVGSPCLRSSYCRTCADLVSDGRLELPWG